MIINEQGAKYETEGKTFVIGEPIYVTDESDYKGLFGIVTEIRDGKDKETENDTVDIHCALDEPVLPFEKEELEKRFSELYQEKKHIEDIALDYVILSPDMLMPVKQGDENTDKIELYIVQEEYCDDEFGVNNYYFTDYILAKQKLNEIVAEDFRNGCVNDWQEYKEFMFESGKDYYEAWIDGRHCEKHYTAQIFHEFLCLSEGTFEKNGKAYINKYLRTCFKEQTEQWDGLEELGDGEYEKLLNSKDLPHRIKEKLESDEAFLEKFWEAFSSLCFDIILEKGESNNEKK